MLLSVDTNILRDRFDDHTAIQMIRDAGFDAFDYSMFRATGERDMLADDYVERAYKLKETADACGILCRQTHAPFAFEYTNKTDLSDPEYVKLVRSLEVASILGAEHIVMHTVKKNLPENFDLDGFSRDFYRSFIPYCEKFNMKISVENLVGRDPVTGEKRPVFSDPRYHQEFVKSLDSKWFDICVDVGHSALLGYPPEDVISAMDPEVFQTIHIHDNYLTHDSHILPYAGKLNWDAITTALAKIGYEGDFSFETFRVLRVYPPELARSCIRLIADTGRYLIGRIEE